MKLSKQHCIYCPAETWERIRRRAKKAKMSISRFGYLCCLRKAGEEPERALAAGHELLLTQTEQDHLYGVTEVLRNAMRLVLDTPEGGTAVVRFEEALRFRLLCNRETKA